MTGGQKRVATISGEIGWVGGDSKRVKPKQPPGHRPSGANTEWGIKIAKRSTKV